MRVRVRPTHKTLFMRVDFPGRRRREGQRWDPSAAHPVRVSFSGSTSRTCSSTIGCLVFVSTRNRVTSFFPGASSCSQLRPVDPPQSPRACRCRGVPDWQVRVCDRGFAEFLNAVAAADRGLLTDWRTTAPLRVGPQRLALRKPLVFKNAGGGSRTHTPLLATDFECVRLGRTFGGHLTDMHFSGTTRRPPPRAIQERRGRA